MNEPKPIVDYDTIPGWEGSVGPFPGQYSYPHVYARSVYSGAGNCMCGREPQSGVHVPVPAAPLGTWTPS